MVAMTARARSSVSEALVDADGDEGDVHVDGDQEGGGKPGEEAEQQKNAADELCEGRDVAEPGGRPRETT